MSDVGHFVYEGKMGGHRDWVTAIACPSDNSNKVLTASRDKTVVDWTRNADRISEDYSTEFANPRKRLEGHSGMVQDVTLSSDALFALTASWDCTLRLWELQSGQTRSVFRGHTKDVLSVAFSPDNRQIVSGGRDCQIKMWNSLGECKYTVTEGGHQDWVSCVRFSPNQQSPYILSGGWDNTVKLWTLSPFRLAYNLTGHTGYVSSVCVSPDGSLCASGGKDGNAMLWDLSTGTHLYKLDADEPIHSLSFSPNRYWLCAASESCLRIWDLESKKEIAQLSPEVTKLGKKALKPECISLAWSADGTTLFTGYTDNCVRVFTIRD